MDLGFISSNRVHLARQKILLEELRKSFNVYIFIYEVKSDLMEECFIDISREFSEWLKDKNLDLMLIRGDRHEILGPTVICAYKGIPVAHLEAGDISGMVDNKVRFSISHLADLHFPTNEESKQRLINCGLPKDKIHNFGSLDVELAKTITTRESKDYIVLLHHPTETENPDELKLWIESVFSGKIYYIKSNADMDKVYGEVELPPEEYIKLIADAKCLVGNSSSFLKEAGIFGTPVTLVGSRQEGRLLTSNVDAVPFNREEVTKSLERQMGSEYQPDETYYQPETSKRIAETIKEFLK